MKLSAIEATVVYPHDGCGYGIPLIQVQTDTGLTGWGETQASRVPEAVCDIVRNLLNPALKNRDFRGDREEVESIWDSMYVMAVRTATCPIFAGPRPASCPRPSPSTARHSTSAPTIPSPLPIRRNW